MEWFMATTDDIRLLDYLVGIITVSVLEHNQNIK